MCVTVVSWGVEGKTIAGSEKIFLSEKSLSLKSSLARPPPLSPKSIQLADVSAQGYWKHVSYKKYIRAKGKWVGKNCHACQAHTLFNSSLGFVAL